MKLRVCTGKEIKKIDQRSEAEFGLSTRILMENAGIAAAAEILKFDQDAGIRDEILIFAGKGNNAGDAFVVARRLFCLERKVRVFTLASEAQYQDATLENYQILKKLGVKLLHLQKSDDLNSFFEKSSGPYTIIDGILGTGLNGEISGLYFDVIEMINRQTDAQIVSLDIPSGVRADNGEVLATSIIADLTISFGFPKRGHFFPPGAAKRGKLVNVDISLPAWFQEEGKLFLMTPEQMTSLLVSRDRYGHKNSFGHCLVIGGSPGKIGAVAMATKACHRMGTGLVTAATWEASLKTLQTKLPDETMAFPLSLEGTKAEIYRQNIHQFSSIVLGPGLGTSDAAKDLIEKLLLNYSGPFVIDADALNLIGSHKMHDLLLKRKAPTVLTPHPGEMARLLNISKEEVVLDPVGAVQRAVELTHSVVILKGAATVIGSTEETFYLNHFPNDGMAKAGSGDVLAGMIGGLLSQDREGFESAQLGVYFHSIAGLIAADKLGAQSMTASDIIHNISSAIKQVKNEQYTQFSQSGSIELL